MRKKVHLRVNTSFPPHDASKVVLMRRGQLGTKSTSKKKRNTPKTFAIFLICFIIFIIVVTAVIGGYASKLEDLSTFLDLVPISIYLPETLDKQNVENDMKKLRDVIILGKDESSPLDNCPPTVQIEMYQRVINGHKSWFIRTFDEAGNAKNIGGDEFFIDYTDWHPEHENSDISDGIEPDAVAIIHDFKNGTYQLDFFSTPMKVTETDKIFRPSRGKGRIKISFEYTCGIGALPQPTKVNWSASGAMYQKALYKDDFPRPTIRNFQPPQSPKLSKYSSVIFFGDSTMRQLSVNRIDENGEKIYFRPNIIYSNNVRSELTKEKMKKHFLRKLFIFHNKELLNSDNIALVMGSSIWDLLVNDNVQGMHFQDHLEACKDLIESVRERYPKVDVFWKSTSALHPHRVNCKEATYEYHDCLNSTKYLSNSRVKILEEKQRLLMQELNVPYLDLYTAYYLSAHYMSPGDGRHSTAILNEKILSWFFD